MGSSHSIQQSVSQVDKNLAITTAQTALANFIANPDTCACYMPQTVYDANNIKVLTYFGNPGGQLEDEVRKNSRCYYTPCALAPILYKGDASCSSAQQICVQKVVLNNTGAIAGSVDINQAMNCLASTTTPTGTTPIDTTPTGTTPPTPPTPIDTTVPTVPTPSPPKPLTTVPTVPTPSPPKPLTWWETEAKQLGLTVLDTQLLIIGLPILIFFILLIIVGCIILAMSSKK